MIEIKRVALYARFSSDHQRTESIDAQIRAMKEFCDHNKWKIVETYIDEAYSATNDRRPSFQRMITDSGKGLFDIVYMNNSSTGGLDFITMGIKAKHPHLPFGNITFAAALAVILLNGAVFQDVDSIIYGIMFNFIVSAVINKMMFGFSSSMLAMIITDDGAAACAEIDRVADRGSTILQGRGGYGGQPKDVVLCACSNKQLYEIEHAVQAIDPGCFIIMLQSNEVHGEGFRQLELGKNENKSE